MGIRRIRLLGATGTAVMAISALGVGAQPVQQNPVSGMRVAGLFARVPTSMLAMCMIGVVAVVLAWLLLGRFAVGACAPRSSRAQLVRTLAVWSAPLVVAPPMFSNDVYSYLAQSEIAQRGMDPYVVGPAAGLGLDNILTNNVPNIWRATPAPYEPLFLWIGRGIAELTGDDILLGVWAHRLLELGGLALIVWALPRLARRCGVSPVAALWLGAANPLVLFHLIAGVHNETLMLGLMLTGSEICLRAFPENVGAAPRLDDRRAWALLVSGAVLISLAAMVKLPAIVALGFVGMALARHWGRRVGPVLAVAAVLATIALTTVVFVCWGSGLGFGWIYTLDVARAVRSWMSLPTALGIVTGFAGVLLGLGDHTTALLSITRPIALAAAGFVALRMLLGAWAGRVHPIGALGISLGALVLLSPVVQPWYLLWAIVPLAAWARTATFRGPAILLTVLVALLQMPRGADFGVFQIIEAASATIFVTIAFIALTRKALPWPRRRIALSSPQGRDVS
ncbi:polyprenol phosphomannose-dependent alpha 1,6 mannosyltransferase MptB [Nocardia pseudobrasiliensis]|uniref:Alpha-1,6-mannosyltransferase n=1 Tax=Nocardia pseudobrasiliensis TaxID=45979 RepID=A0A370I927_9NOCA|nr:polyprenol phosphomannose-dependent alpha 1,6 mannosyltransferase MptB [Nocardia pseudobrasiliensis]RDI67232.1 alpha-1,6-mannosyltransferase [Nocardia pseudobrasiliensis]